MRLTLAEAAQRLGIPASTLEIWADAGIGPPSDRRRIPTFEAKHLDAWLTENRKTLGQMIGPSEPHWPEPKKPHNLRENVLWMKSRFRKTF